MKKITWSIEIRPIICQEVETETWEKAKEELRKTFEDQPWELGKNLRKLTQSP